MKTKKINIVSFKILMDALEHATNCFNYACNEEEALGFDGLDIALISTTKLLQIVNDQIKQMDDDDDHDLALTAAEGDFFELRARIVSLPKNTYVNLVER